jgi:predicted methyltransferase MtxX (methanogen marker protein 4)
MALQSSGQISGDINVELGRTRTASISLDTAENVVTLLLMQGVQINHQQQIQLQLSEWYKL